MQQSLRMAKPIFLAAIVLVAVSAVAPAAFQNIRGSLVVAIVSPKADYVVVAAESRNTNGCRPKLRTMTMRAK